MREAKTTVVAVVLFALHLLPSLAAGEDVDLCVPECATPRPLAGLASGGSAVTVKACLNDTVNITIIPPAEDDKRTYRLRVTDLHLDGVHHVIFLTEHVEETQNIFSLSHHVVLSLSWEEGQDGGADPPLGVYISCLEYIVNEPPEIGMDNSAGNASLLLAPNSRYVYSFRSSNINMFNLSFGTGDTVAGFALAELEDGTFALSTSNSSLAVQNSNYVTRIHLFTAGSQVEADLAWDLGKPKLSTTVLPTTSTTPTPDKNELITMFVVAVNEVDFVMQHQDQLVNLITDIFDRACENMTAMEYLHPSVSCRQSCFMTDSTDRGCVKVVIDLTFFPQLVNCPAFTKGAQTQYLRGKLEEMLDELASQYQASEVVLDSCTTISISSPWVLGALAITALSLLLALLILVVARWATHSRRRLQEEMVVEGKGMGYTSMKDSHWEVYND